eukprot:TRINITY_DN4748_c0_g1_i10.p1 TRINITY_DN4748_c0_g1~~TRINITY_DN4748_c0_g1_i10.p1  ORF type:complete len:479 (-),score=146.30 TRINITY_DN4748_c0_g1_i10:48-1484(-)
MDIAEEGGEEKDNPAKKRRVADVNTDAQDEEREREKERRALRRQRDRDDHNVATSASLVYIPDADPDLEEQKQSREITLDVGYHSVKWVPPALPIPTPRLRIQTHQLIEVASREQLIQGLAQSFSTAQLRKLIHYFVRAAPLPDAQPTIETIQSRLLFAGVVPRENAALPFLPEKSWARVLSYLDVSTLLCNVSSVSRAFGSLVRSPDSWRTFIVSSYIGHRLKFQDFSNLASCWSNARHIDLNGCDYCDDAWLTRMAGQCTSLRVLRLGHCSKITDQGIMALVQSGLTSELVDLSLRDCRNLTDAAIQAIVNSCSGRLKYLDVRGCRNLTDASLNAIAGATLLRELELSECRDVSDAGVKQIAQSCPALRTLTLSHCRSITDEALQALAQTCTQLEEVGLGWCDQLTDNGIASLTAACHKLALLDLSDCRKITQETLRFVLRDCQEIKQVDLSGCDSVDRRGRYYVDLKRICRIIGP